MLLKFLVCVLLFSEVIEFTMGQQPPRRPSTDDAAAAVAPVTNNAHDGAAADYGLLPSSSSIEVPAPPPPLQAAAVDEEVHTRVKRKSKHGKSNGFLKFLFAKRTGKGLFSMEDFK
jgi:hypothetical protein